MNGVACDRQLFYPKYIRAPRRIFGARVYEFGINIEGSNIRQMETSA
jgi:hypothetical protein